MKRCEQELCGNWAGGPGCPCAVLGLEPDFVNTLSSGAELTSDPLTLHPLIAEDLDCQTREMEQARAQAAVSCHDYLVSS